MDRNYAEFELINEELHNLSTAAYFTKACKYTPLIPHPALPYLTKACKYTPLIPHPALPYLIKACKYTPPHFLYHILHHLNCKYTLLPTPPYITKSTSYPTLSRTSCFITASKFILFPFFIVDYPVLLTLVKPFL